MSDKTSVHTRTGAAEAGVALLDLSCRPLAMDEGAVSILSRVGEETAPANASALPSAVVRQIRSAMLAPGNPSEWRFTAGRATYVARACVMASRDGALGGPCIAVRFQRAAEAADRLSKICREFHLTDREKEALSGIATGLTSKEVAQRMNIAPSTVKAFLRLMMLKTGAANRAGMVAMLIGESGAEPPSPKSSQPSNS